MLESQTENTHGIWNPPQCPFAVEYSPRVLDDIRLSVVDAFFSLPRGGAEVGGILLGKYDGARVVISDYRPLDCEHAFGPTFTLSARDLEKLKDFLPDLRGRLLAEKSRLESAQTHVAAAAAWARASKKTL